MSRTALPVRHLTCLCLATALLASFGPAAAGAPAAEQPAQQQADLNLQQALPEEAFSRLGHRFGCRFALVDDQQWIGPDLGVTVTADLSGDTFWQAVMRLAEQTGYEPVFRPYGREEGQLVIWLQRVDVAAEERPRPAVASGPVLVRSTRAWFSVPLEMARLRLVPVQVALETEVFVEPGEPAVFATAVRLRAVDEARRPLTRAEGLDPTAGIDQGICRLVLHFDARRGIPSEISNWSGELRLVRDEGSETLTLPLMLLERPRDQQPAAEAPATAPPEPTHHALGPYQLLLEPAYTHDTPEREGEPARRILTTRLTFQRAELDHTTWSRLYGFLVAIPPDVAGEGQSPWEPAGYAIWGPPTPGDESLAASYRVLARFEAPANASDPQHLEWSLPVRSNEERTTLTWRTPVPIEVADEEEEELPRPQRPVRPSR